VVVYKEQVLEIAVRVAGFTPAEADRLRRTMSRARSKAEMQSLGDVFCARAAERGVERKAAEEIWQTLLGYASYGFAEGHAAAFGLIGYRTLYLLEHHSAVWYAALLNHQPMGYYPPQTLITEARRRGIQVRLPDVNRSEPTWTIQDGALSCGLLQVRGMGTKEAELVLANRPYRTVWDLVEKSRLLPAALRQLVLAGALDGLVPNRRQALWQVEGQAAMADLADFTPERRLSQEMAALGLAVSAHPLSFFRAQLEQAGVLRTDQALCAPHRMQVAVAGVLVRPHRPPTRSGERVVFLCLEDERGLCDVTVPEAVYRQDADAIFGPDAWMVVVEGTVREVGTGASLDAERVMALTAYLNRSSVLEPLGG
jgi:error-prone DNA polymerase